MNTILEILIFFCSAENHAAHMNEINPVIFKYKSTEYHSFVWEHIILEQYSIHTNRRNFNHTYRQTEPSDAETDIKLSAVCL